MHGAATGRYGGIVGWPGCGVHHDRTRCGAAVANRRTWRLSRARVHRVDDEDGTRGALALHRGACPTAPSSTRPSRRTIAARDDVVNDPLLLLAVGASLGFVIGMLGGGGGILAVPLLVAVGLPFLEASTLSLVIVGAGAIAALVPHHHAGRVDWRVGLVFGALGAVGAVAGSRLAAVLSPVVLLAGLAVLLVGGALAMLRAATGELSRAESNAEADLEPVEVVVEDLLGAGTAAAPTTTRSPTTSRVRVVALATSVGLVTGLLGVGAGFVVVPALVTAMKLPIKKATATALVVIVINSAVALSVRHASLGSPGVAAALAAASAVFAVVGALVSRRVPSWVLSGSFGVLMLLVAGYTIVKALLSA